MINMKMPIEITCLLLMDKHKIHEKLANSIIYKYIICSWCMNREACLAAYQYRTTRPNDSVYTINKSPSSTYVTYYPKASYVNIIPCMSDYNYKDINWSLRVWVKQNRNYRKSLNNFIHNYFVMGIVI